MITLKLKIKFLLEAESLTGLRICYVSETVNDLNSIVPHLKILLPSSFGYAPKISFKLIGNLLGNDRDMVSNNKVWNGGHYI